MEKKKHPAGLTEAEAIESRRQHGTNILTPAAKIPLWKQFLEKFSDPIIRILLIEPDQWNTIKSSVGKEK